VLLLLFETVLVGVFSQVIWKSIKE